MSVLLPTILDRNGAPPKAFFVPILKSNLLVQYGSSLAFQSFHDFLGILRLDSHFFQGDAKVLEEQVEVRVVQTVISGEGMGVMNTFPCIHSSAEEHGMNIACRDRRCAMSTPSKKWRKLSSCKTLS